VITSAFVLGAGLGTRLKTLTQQRPKPLIPVANKPLITYAFDHLLAAGVKRFVVNTHWRAEVYDSVFPDGAYGGAPLTFRHEAPEVLETAGGIKNVEDLLGGETFIVYNGDILTDLPIEDAIRAHFAQDNEVTMVLRSKDGPLQVSFDPATSRITDIGKKLDPASEADFLFTGVYIVGPHFFSRIPPREKISVIPIFLQMIREGARLGGIVLDEGRWWDLGARSQYLAVHAHFGSDGFQNVPDPRHGPWVANNARVSPSAKITGATAIGSGVTIGDHASLHDCIVWENAAIGAGSLLNDCIIRAGSHVDGIHSHADL
jgi:mannose-1-phosphate guanylyltransferase